MSHLDWTDPTAVRRWVADLRVVADDLHTVVEDMLRRPRARELGPVTHREKCDEARHALVAMLAYALPPGDAGPEATR